MLADTMKMRKRKEREIKTFKKHLCEQLKIKEKSKT
jgi:hypothetical protein